MRCVLILISVFLIFSNNALAEKNNHQETELNQINILGNELDDCNKNYSALYNNALKEMASLEIQRINEETIACYKNVAQKIIKRFYKHNQKKMINAVNRFIEEAYKSNGDLYADSDFCIPSCGLIWNAQHSTAAKEDTYLFILRMLINIEKNISK